MSVMAPVIRVRSVLSRPQKLHPACFLILKIHTELKIQRYIVSDASVNKSVKLLYGNTEIEPAEQIVSRYFKKILTVFKQG